MTEIREKTASTVQKSSHLDTMHAKYRTIFTVSPCIGIGNLRGEYYLGEADINDVAVCGREGKGNRHIKRK